MFCNGDAEEFIQCSTAHEGQKKTWGVSSIGKILGSLGTPLAEGGYTGSRGAKGLRAKRLAGFFRRAAKSMCPARALAILLGIFLFGGEAARAADTAKLFGVVFTLGTDQVQTVWPNARVTLKNKETRNAVSSVTSDLGEFSFVGVAPGEYELTVALAG